MALNLTPGATAYELMIDNFSKTLTYTPVSERLDNITGDQNFTDGGTSSVTGAFFRKEDAWFQDKSGLLQNADAILLIKMSVTLNKDDKITYDGEDYRVQKVVTRSVNGVNYHKTAQLFKV